MPKPLLFVGSSVEGLKIAQAVQENLDPHDAWTKVWPQGVFGVADYTLDSLLEALKIHDFGAFVFSADDVIFMRHEKHKAVRDNVLFELGLFMGHLGRARTFIIAPQGHELHFPSDLSGLTPATYDAERVQSDPIGGLAVACNKIRRAIQLQGALLKEPHIGQVSSIAAPLEEKPPFAFLSIASPAQKSGATTSKKKPSDVRKKR